MGPKTRAFDMLLLLLLLLALLLPLMVLMLQTLLLLHGPAAGVLPACSAGFANHKPNLHVAALHMPSCVDINCHLFMLRATVFLQKTHIRISLCYAPTAMHVTAMNGPACVKTIWSNVSMCSNALQV